VPGGTREVFKRRCKERPSALEIEKSRQSSKGIEFIEGKRDPRFTWFKREQPKDETFNALKSSKFERNTSS
jgi:hypothetical protein